MGKGGEAAADGGAECTGLREEREGGGIVHAVDRKLRAIYTIIKHAQRYLIFQDLSTSQKKYKHTRLELWRLLLLNCEGCYC